LTGSVEKEDCSEKEEQFDFGVDAVFEKELCGGTW